MLGSGSVTCAIMAFNEEATLEEATRTVSQGLLQSGREHEILIIDDGSTDRTAELARDLQRSIPWVSFIQHERNRGPGSAILTGAYAAQGELFCFHPADNQLIFSDVVQALPLLDHQYDLLVGERSDRHDYSAVRRLYSYGYIGLAWMLFGLHGFKDFNFVYAYRREIFDRIHVETSGLFMCTEILVKALDEGYRAGVMKARYMPRKAGVSTVGNSKVATSTLKQMLQFWWHRRRP